MASRAARGDYLYLSTREVERLVATLREPPSTALNVKAPGWGVSLVDAPPSTVLGVAADVEDALRDQQRVRQVAEADLAVGDWFESPGLQMAYGVQSARRSEDSDAAVFVAQIDEHAAGAESSLLLSGSADHLLDQGSIRVEDVSGDMSYPSALFALLASLSDRTVTDPSARSDVELSAEDRRAPAHRRATTRAKQAREEQWLAVGYPMAQAQSSFGRRGLFPLSFLARAVKVVNFESQGLSGRWVVGTPLWVARQLPE
jgi:Family of unknown function (DUF7019)